MKLLLGCCDTKIEGFIGVDIVPPADDGPPWTHTISDRDPDPKPIRDVDYTDPAVRAAIAGFQPLRPLEEAGDGA